MQMYEFNSKQTNEYSEICKRYRIFNTYLSLLRARLPSTLQNTSYVPYIAVHGCGLKDLKINLRLGKEKKNVPNLYRAIMFADRFLSHLLLESDQNIREMVSKH